MKLKLFCLWFATWSVAASASQEPGYLACVGPMPLRFLAVLPPRTNQFALPAPVAVVEPPPNAKVEKPVLAKVVEPTPLVPALAPVITEADSRPAPTMSDSISQEGVISPRIFLKYFNQSTNSATASAPMGFTPPRTDKPAASKAASTTAP